MATELQATRGQVARWLEILSEYNMDIEHRPGRQHTNADALSRSPCSQCGKDAEDRSSIEEPDLIALAQCSDTWLLKWSPTDLRKHQYSDEDLKVVIQWLEKNSVPSRFPKDGSHYLKALWNQRSQLILQEGVLYRHWKDIPGNGANQRLQLVLPTCLVPDILTELHNSPTGGHLGANKTYEKMRSRIYYVNLQKTVEDWCRRCELCSSRKAPTKKPRAPMQLSVTSKPMERIAMDILGPLPTTARNNKYILVVGDYFSKWKEAYPMPNMEATTIANLLVNEFICRFGVPECLHTDQGRNFEASLIKEMCRLLGIHKTRTTPYHPQSDGLIERFNRTLLSMLSIAAREDEHNWDLKLPTLLFAYRTSVHETTGETPSLLMLGREARLPVDIMLNLTPNKADEPRGNAYTQNLKENISQAYDRVRTRMNREQHRQKAVYDRSSDDRKYLVGEKVWLHCPAVPRGCSSKFHRPWRGPYTVIKVLDRAVYRIQHDGISRKRLIVHSNRLKPCYGKHTPSAPSNLTPPIESKVPDSKTQSKSDDDILIDLQVQHNTEQGDPTQPLSESEADEQSESENSTEMNESTRDPDQEEDAPPLRRSTRQRRPPDWYGTVVTFSESDSSDEL